MSPVKTNMLPEKRGATMDTREVKREVRSNVELMNRTVSQESIRVHMLRALAERTKECVQPLSIDLGARMPTVKEMTDIAFMLHGIATFAEFLCELNTLEYAMALKVRQLVDEKRGK